MKRLLLAAIVLLVPLTVSAADTRTVSVTWTAPANYSDATCVTVGAPIPPADLATMIHVLSWKVGAGAWQILEMPPGQTTAEIVNAPVGSVIEAYVGARRPDGAIVCPSSHTTYTVPALIPGCPGNPVMTIK